MAVPGTGRGLDGQSCRETRITSVTATQNPPTEQPKTASGRPYATVNPYTGETEKEFPFLETGAIDGVVEKAHAAFLEWRRRPVEERAPIVGRAGELMLERKDEFAALVTREMGKRIQEAGGEVQLAASILDYYATNGPRFLEPRRIERDEGRGRRRERADRRSPRHRAVELPALPGGPGRRAEPGARQRDPAQARRGQPADRPGDREVLPRRRRPRGRLHQRVPAPSPTSRRSSRTRSCRA